MWAPSACTYSVLLRVLSWLSCGRLMTACPSSLSGPTRARCWTWTCSVERSVPPPPPGCSCGRSKVASSFHTGATLFSATVVWYFSFPTCMTANASLVPPFPLIFRPRAWSTVTWTLVGRHSWSARDMLTQHWTAGLTEHNPKTWTAALSRSDSGQKQGKLSLWAPVNLRKEPSGRGHTHRGCSLFFFRSYKTRPHEVTTFNVGRRDG